MGEVPQGEEVPGGRLSTRLFPGETVVEPDSEPRLRPPEEATARKPSERW